VVDGRTGWVVVVGVAGGAVVVVGEGNQHTASGPNLRHHRTRRAWQSRSWRGRAVTGHRVGPAPAQPATVASVHRWSHRTRGNRAASAAPLLSVAASKRPGIATFTSGTSILVVCGLLTAAGSLCHGG
jgi:hypothetical protein